MSVKCTIAGFAQNWHFTLRLRHRRWRLGTLLLLSRQRRAGIHSTFLQRPDAVAQPCGFLVIFLMDRLLEPVAQLHQLALRLFVLRQAAWRLAAMARFAVNVFQQRRQFFAEFGVVVGTAQPAAVAEFDE